MKLSGTTLGIFNEGNAVSYGGTSVIFQKKRHFGSRGVVSADQLIDQGHTSSMPKNIKWPLRGSKPFDDLQAVIIGLDGNEIEYWPVVAQDDNAAPCILAFLYSRE